MSRHLHGGHWKFLNTMFCTDGLPGYPEVKCIAITPPWGDRGMADVNSLCVFLLGGLLVPPLILLPVTNALQNCTLWKNMNVTGWSHGHSPLVPCQSPYSALVPFTEKMPFPQLSGAWEKNSLCQTTSQCKNTLLGSMVFCFCLLCHYRTIHAPIYITY